VQQQLGSRADHPAGAREADFRSVHVRLEGGTDILDELSTDLNRECKLAGPERA